MTGGDLFGLDEIQSDDELLDRLAAREPDAGDGLEALLGAWVRDIEDDADQVAGTPMPWMGQARPKLRAVKVHRTAAVAGALVVTLSGGMAAVALTTPTAGGARIGVAAGIFERILPSSQTAVSTTASTTSQVIASQAGRGQPTVGTAPATAGRAGTWSSPVVVTSTPPGVPQTPSTVPSTTAPVLPPDAGEDASTDDPPASEPGTTTSPATGTTTAPAPDAPVTTGPALPTAPGSKDSSPVTTPGGVLTGTTPALPGSQPSRPTAGATATTLPATPGTSVPGPATATTTIAE